MRFHRQPPGRLPRLHGSRDKNVEPIVVLCIQRPATGPFPEAQLRDLITRGTVRADTLVWTEGMSGWQRAGEIPGLVPGGSGPPSIPQPGGPPPMARAAAMAAVALSIDFRHSGSCSGAACVFIIGMVLVIPAPWVATWFYRWIVSRASRAGTAEPRLHRPGRRHLVRLHRDRHSDLCGRGRPLLPAISLDPDSGCVCPGWSFAGSPRTSRSNGQPLPIAFSGSALGYVGWQVLLYVSVITIVGWAWVITAWMRWICRNIRARGAKSSSSPPDWKCCGEPSCS